MPPQIRAHAFALKYRLFPRCRKLTRRGSAGSVSGFKREAMMRAFSSSTIITAIALWIAPLACGAIVITDGAARFALNTENDFTGGAFKPADFQPEGASGVDHLFENFWSYNAEGLSQNAFFTFGTPNVSGNTATIPITALNQFLTGTITLSVQHGARTGEATVTQSLAIMNSGTTTSNNWRLFYYGDFDVDGNASSNTATLLDADTIRVQHTGSPTVLDVTAQDPISAYEVGTYSTMRDTLMGFPAHTLTNTGLPFGPGNYTGAYEWDFTLPAGQTETRSITFSVIVPEPACLVLIPATVYALRRPRGASGWRARRRL
jgi:hypothetical protein